MPSIVVDVAVPADLEARFLDVKKSLVKKEDIEAVKESWKRVILALENEAKICQEEGSKRVPVFHWDDIVKNDYKLNKQQSALFKERGCAMVKGVVDRPQIDKWFEELCQFSKDNPETAGYTFPNPTSWYNLFWTKPQNEARSHPNIAKLTEMFSNQFYVNDTEESLIDLDSLIVYGDRIRIRQPGAGAALTLHLDSSSIERWEDEKFRETYKEIFEGRWEDWDAYNLDVRQFAQEDLYHHLDTKRPTICSSFRTLQGWLGLSDNKTGEGTLKVLPNVKLAMAYVMLRPLFWKDPELGNLDDYEIDLETPKFPGAAPSTGQLFLDDELFPHLRQCQTVVGIPDVEKGDFVFWHADLPHEVDKEHNGDGHSSVLYYGVTPLAIPNVETLLDTRDAFTRNVSPRDYRSQLPENVKENQGADIAHLKTAESRRGLGLSAFEITDKLTPSQLKIRKIANEALQNGHFDASAYLK